jgi:hypothetical protein
MDMDAARITAARPDGGRDGQVEWRREPGGGIALQSRATDDRGESVDAARAPGPTGPRPQLSAEQIRAAATFPFSIVTAVTLHTHERVTIDNFGSPE